MRWRTARQVSRMTYPSDQSLLTRIMGGVFEILSLVLVLRINQRPSPKLDIKSLMFAQDDYICGGRALRPSAQCLFAQVCWVAFDSVLLDRQTDRQKDRRQASKQESNQATKKTANYPTNKRRNKRTHERNNEQMN